MVDAPASGVGGHNARAGSSPAPGTAPNFEFAIVPSSFSYQIWKPNHVTEDGLVMVRGCEVPAPPTDLGAVCERLSIPYEDICSHYKDGVRYYSACVPEWLRALYNASGYRSGNAVIPKDSFISLAAICAENVDLQDAIVAASDIDDIITLLKQQGLI